VFKFTDQSGNAKKESKKSIYVTVRNLKNLRLILKDNLNVRTSETSQPRNKVKELKKELETHRVAHTTRYISPSTGNFPELYRDGNVDSTQPRDGGWKL
jgi:hypothetical protein